jgi:hypothetical protein
MGAHPRVSAPSPTHLFRLFATNAGNYGDLENDANWGTLIRDFTRAFGSKLGVWPTEVTADELQQQAKTRTTAELLRLVYEKEADNKKATHVFVKENNIYLFIPFLLVHFPTCKFVLMVRDPRDVASSWVRTDSIPGGVEKAVDTWIKDQSEFLSLYRQMRGSRRIVFLRYEDLILQPVRQLTDLCQFVGLKYDDRMLEFYEHSDIGANAERIEAWGNLRRPIINDNAGKYKDALRDDEIRYVELRCYEVMTEFGYTPDLVHGLPDEETREVEVARLRTGLNQGNYVVKDNSEHEIRQRRLEAIETVLSRQLR